MIKRGASEYGAPLFIVYGLIRFLVSVEFWWGGFSLLCNDISGDFMTRRGRISCGCHFLV